MSKKQKKMLYRILFAAALMVVLHFVPAEGPARFVLYLIPYLTAAYDILWKAVKGIRNGQVFDENFLMAVASIGALALGLTRTGDYVEAVAVMLFYQVGELFQSVAVGKSRRNISDLMDIRPDYANVEENGELVEVDPEDVAIGTEILVKPGERIPIDGIVTEGTSTLDTAALTGESIPRDVAPGNEIVSGCINMTGLLRIRTTKEFGESTVAKILDMVENATSMKSRSENFISRFARVYTPAVCISALVLAILPPLVQRGILQQTPDWADWFYRALTFLVISCPCALVLSVPLSFFAGIGAGSRLGILFKGGSALEMLKNVAAVVMDKTGTVTQGNFVVHDVVPADGVTAEELLGTAAGAETASIHPIAVSIVRAAEEKGIRPVRPDRFQERAGEGLTVYYGTDRILAGNLKLMKRCGIAARPLQNVNVGSEVYVAKNDRFLGAMVIRDTVKPDARDSVEALRKDGLVTVMLTGDAPKEAEAVAREVGIQEVRAGLLPQDKLNEMNTLRGKYGAVLFVGDGINDAPVLAGADVGAAMGSGADAAMEAADIVFMNSEMGAIPRAVRIAKTVGSVAWQNVVFALVVKVVIMAAGIFGYANMWAAVFADTGVSVICVLNACRILYMKF